MGQIQMVSARVACVRLLSSLLMLLTLAVTATAHEVMPAIARMQQSGDVLEFTVDLNLEAMLAGVDLDSVADTNESDKAEAYDILRGLDPVALQSQFESYWPIMAQSVVVAGDDTPLVLALTGVSIPADTDPAAPRQSTITFNAQLNKGTAEVEVFWPRTFGLLVLRQEGVEEPFTAEISGGSGSGPIPLAGGGSQSAGQAFASYIPIGFAHIVPLGLDHILFVLGLFFLSTRWRPLLAQVSAFTLAHTITLALAALGLVRAPGAIVEPAIAASIVFVAVENIYSKGLNPWRPLIVFLFGLLHGLGFASVLGEYGLPEGNFIPALIGFNVGVEFGQLAVIACAFIAVGFWFGDKPWYRRVIAVPASIGIAVVGAWWFVERTLL